MRKPDHCFVFMNASGLLDFECTQSLDFPNSQQPESIIDGALLCKPEPELKPALFHLKNAACLKSEAAQVYNREECLDSPSKLIHD